MKIETKMCQQSDTGGVKPFSIGGRMVRERERLQGMTDVERAWRAQYLKDFELSPREPVFVPELYRATLNPIRRFYRFPLDTMEKAIAPVVGANWASHIRYYTGKIGLGLLLTYAVYYHFKYNGKDWTRHGGFVIYSSKPKVWPGQPGYPFVSERNKFSDYEDASFKNAPI